jgi:hypothetical protein
MEAIEKRVAEGNMFLANFLLDQFLRIFLRRISADIPFLGLEFKVGVGVQVGVCWTPKAVCDPCIQVPKLSPLTPIIYYAAAGSSTTFSTLPDVLWDHANVPRFIVSSDVILYSPAKFCFVFMTEG